MKRLLTIVLLLGTAVPAMAQVVTDAPLSEQVAPTEQQVVPLQPEQPASLPAFKPNEFDVSLGIGSSYQALMLAGTALANILIPAIVKTDVKAVIPIPIPDLGLEYDRWVSDKVAIGVNVRADATSMLPYQFTIIGSAMATAKLQWFANENIRCYSKIGAGYRTFIIYYNDGGNSRIETFNVQDYIGSTSTPTSVNSFSDLLRVASGLVPPSLAWQATPIGLDFTTAVSGLNFFMEFSVGTNSVLIFGAKIPF